MFKIFYADKDATLYKGMPDTNTGIDEVLEIGKRYGADGTTLYESRALVKFNTTEIQKALNKQPIKCRLTHSLTHSLTHLLTHIKIKEKIL